MRDLAADTVGEPDLGLPREMKDTMIPKAYDREKAKEQQRYLPLCY